MISKSLEETKAKFDNIITYNEDLEMNVEEYVWASDYKEKKEEVEEIYGRLVAEVSVVAVQHEDACEKQEKQRKAEEVTAASGEGRGGATAG